jgi:streptomycin 6-kinase
VTPSGRVVLVAAELGQLFQSIFLEVLERLRPLFGDLYTEHNVILSATHTHSGPGGYSGYALYDFANLGFNQGDLASDGCHMRACAISVHMLGIQF